jgi:hypothetical protein
VDRATRCDDGLVVEPQALHELARTLRRCASSLQLAARAAAATGTGVDDLPPPADAAAQAFLGAVGRALLGESDAVGALARSMDAAASDYVAQERRLTTALGG